MRQTNLNITGADQVMKNLRKAIQDVEARSEKGLVRAGLLIMRESSRLVPVDLGNLKGSVYLVSNKAVNHAPTPSFHDGRKDASKQERNRASALADARARVGGSTPMVEIGYSTTYAAAVHEHVHVPHSVGQAKYLETAVKANAAKIVDIIKQDALIP